MPAYTERRRRRRISYGRIALRIPRGFPLESCSLTVLFVVCYVFVLRVCCLEFYDVAYLLLRWPAPVELRPLIGPLSIPHMTRERERVEWQRNDIDTVKPKVSVENIPQCHFVQHRSCVDCPGEWTRVSVVINRRLTAWVFVYVTASPG